MKTVLYFQSSLSPFNMRELEGAREFAHNAHWNLRVFEYDGAAKSRFHTAGGDIVSLREQLAFWKPSGCIVECGGRPPRLGKRDVGRNPVVFLDCHPSDAGKGALCAWHDETVIGMCAARELMALGLGDFAFLPWPESDLSWNRIRGEAFASCIREGGGRLHVFANSSSVVDVLRLRNEVSEWIGGLPRPCGVFAANDILAALFVEMALAAGLSVPKDFAVVGVDNDATLCEDGAVSITSIESDARKVGYCAAELLARRMDGHVGSRLVSVEDVYLCRRASTRLFRAADVRVVKALEFIRKRACSGITPPDVVAEMGCSRRLADLRFRETTGHTILDEIHSVRIGKVKELLRKGGHSASHVADKTGYSSAVDLCRVFKRISGTTMRRYQKAAAEGG